MKPRNKAGQLDIKNNSSIDCTVFPDSPFAPSAFLPIYVVVHMPILPFKLCDATVASITAARKGKLGNPLPHLTYFLTPSFTPNINSICVPKDPPQFLHP